MVKAMDLQVVFDKAKVMYLEIVNDITKMALAMEELAKRTGNEFKPQITIMKFDLVLQYSLLQVACSDYDLAQNEIVFIKNLTKFADYCDYVSSVANKSLSWSDLLGSDITAVRSLLRTTDEDMLELSKEVVAVFSLYDKATEYDYFTDLKNNVCGIIASLSIMDGDATSEDYNQDILIFSCLDAIEKILKS